MTGVAGGQPDLPGAGRQAALDELPGQFGAQQLAVDLGAGLGEQLDRRRAVVANADLGQHAGRLFVNELALGRAEIDEPAPCHADLPSSSRSTSHAPRSTCCAPAAAARISRRRDVN